jgi:cold-inducible RNA-binding protein
MRLYVGNLSFNSTEDSIRKAFSAFGEVSSIHMVTDRDTGRPRGFGFVEMVGPAEGQAAIDALNGSDLEGRALNVNEARPRPERGFGEGGGGRGGRSSRW